MKLLKKASLAVIMVCVMVLCTVFCAANVSAAAVTASGECGDNLTWTLYDDGELVIEGEGDMWDFKQYGPKETERPDETPWWTIRSNISKITIKHGVTSIGEYAFNNCPTTSITIPNSVHTIDKYAFFYCTSLTDITLPDSITSIGNSAFSSCQKLERFTIPSRVQSIGEAAFLSCANLKNVTVLSKAILFDGSSGIFALTHADFTLYGYASSTTEVYASKHRYNFVIREIIASGECGDNLTWTLYDNGEFVIEGEGDMWNWEYRFGDMNHKNRPWYSNLSNITTVTIHEGVTSIGDLAFMYCTNLTNVTIPDSIATIGEAAFVDCGRMVNFKFPSKLTFIGGNAFFGCSSLSGTLEIPLGVVYIGGHAFADCSNIEKIIINEGTEIIGGGAFGGCTNLSEIHIPSTVKKIAPAPSEYATFYGPTLNKITILSKDVTFGFSEDFNIFDYCPNLTIYGFVNSTTQTYTSKHGVPFVALDESTALPGDINGDDSVDISDALLLFMHSMLPEQYPIDDSINVDFNKDGSIDIADALLLFMHSMLPEEYPLN